VLAERDIDLRFRGCASKRILDVPRSLARYVATGSTEPVLCTAERWIGER
jgi:hypothetical protein